MTKPIHRVQCASSGESPSDESTSFEQLAKPESELGLIAAQAALREQIDLQSVPSGVLLEGPADGDALDAFDGSEASPIADPFQWRNAWDLIRSSRVAEVDGLDVDLDALASQAGTAVPIVVADLNYERARPRWVAALKSEQVPGLSELIQPGRAFMATSLLPSRSEEFRLRPGCHHGLEVEFAFAGHLGNVAAAGTSYSLDLGDGPARPFSPQQPVRHRYAAPGVKTLTLRAQDAAGQQRVAHFSVEIGPKAPKPDVIWKTGPGALDCAYVYYGRPGGTKRNHLEQPVLLSDGFPGGRTIDDLWPLINQSRFVDSLLDAGKDMIIIGYQDGSKAIGESAKQYIAVIERAIAERVGNARLVVGGASMGGLIARYALCKLDDGDKHQTRLFYTIDTPHHGANIPISAQVFLQLYHDQNQATKEGARQINSVAAQQMLLYWIPPRSVWRDGGRLPPASAHRHAFVKELESIGWMPKNVERRIAVADGLGTGHDNGVVPGARCFWFECTVFAWANLWAAKDAPSKIAALQRGLDKWEIRAGWQRIDGAPGGTSDIWQQLYDGVNGFPRELQHGSHCFVSTTSACGIAGDPYIPVSLQNSEFHAFATSTTTNLGHVDLPAELKNFLVGEIAELAPTGPVVPQLPIHHPDCLHTGDAVYLRAPANGHVFRRDPKLHDGMVARGPETFRDARLIVLREGANLNFRSVEPTAAWLGRVQRPPEEQPFEASKQEVNLWTRLTPERRDGRTIALRADNGPCLVPVQRPAGLRLEALGRTDQGVFISLAEHTLADGDVMALRADNGRFVSRMGASWGRPIAATKQQPDIHCRFVVRNLERGRVALRNEGTHYIKVMTRDETRIEAVSEQLDAYGHFVLELLGDNRVALRGIIGGYAQRVDYDQEIRPTADAVGPRSSFELVLLARASSDIV